MLPTQIVLLAEQLDEPCEDCINEVFHVLMDPFTQHLLGVWGEKRKGLLRLHVHKPGLLDGQGPAPAIFFHTYLYLDELVAVPHWTTSSKTIEGAFDNLAEELRLEAQRLNPTEITRVTIQRRRKRADRKGREETAEDEH